MRVAVGQIAPVLGDVAANIGTLDDYCARAKEAGAALIVFPEMVDTGYAMAVIAERATSWTEGAVPALCTTARRLSLAIICGVSEREGDRIYNSQVFIDASGRGPARRASHQTYYAAFPLGHAARLAPSD